MVTTRWSESNYERVGHLAHHGFPVHCILNGSEYDPRRFLLAVGGRATLGAGAASDIDVPVVEGTLEFETAAADVRHVFAEEADGGVGGDGGAGLVDLLLVDEDASGKDEGAGALTALGEIAVDEEDVDAGFGGTGQ